MLRRVIATAFLLGGVALLSLAARAYFAPLPAPALVVAEPELELEDCKARQQTDVVFRLENHSKRPVRVLGLVTC